MMRAFKFFQSLLSKSPKGPDNTFQATQVATILHKVDPDLRQDVLNSMSPKNSRVAERALTNLRPVTQHHHVCALARHLKVKLTGYLLQEQNLEERLLATLESCLRSDAARTARELEAILGRRVEISIGEALEVRKKVKQRGCWIAILLSSLPEELAHHFLMSLEQSTGETVKQVRCKLRVSELERQKTVARFLGLPEKEHQLPFLLQAVESVCRTSPESSLRRLEEWDWECGSTQGDEANVTSPV